MKRPYWHDAYDAQMGLWRWYRTDGGKRWMSGLFADARGIPESFRGKLAKIYDGEMGRLVECDPVYVSPEMTDVVDVARESFEPEPLHEWDLATPRAFVYYARPVEIRDRNGDPIAIQAFSWAQEYAVADDRVDEFFDRFSSPEAETEHGPRLTVSEAEAAIADGLVEAHGIGVTIYAVRDAYVESAAHGDEKAAAMLRRQAGTVPVVPCHLTPWQYGQTFAGNEIDVEGRPTGAQDWWKLLQTTLRLMQQKRPRSGYGRPDRATRRAAERLGFRPDTEILIVRLRKEEAPRPEDSEPSGRSLLHRHLRTGHWRNQWYPSEQIHRQIYIDPTVVGDPSLPLLVRPRRVFQWTR